MAAAALPCVHWLLLPLAAAVEDDVLCLEGVKSSLASWTFANTSASHICNLEGVACWNLNENRIISIQLTGFGLSGGLPESLKNCHSLQTLDLSQNKLDGPIPPQICLWFPYLVKLDLSSNSLSGPIPIQIADFSLPPASISAFLPFSRSARVPAGSYRLSSEVQFRPSFLLARWNAPRGIASDMDSKKSVRSVLESFLLSGAASKDGAKGDQPDVRGEAGEAAAEAPAREVKMELGESGGRVICELSDRRYVTLQDYNSTNMVSIRDYYIKDGKNFPSAKGISLTKDQWSALSSSLPSIEEAIKKMESKLSKTKPAKTKSGDMVLHSAFGSISFDHSQRTYSVCCSFVTSKMMRPAHLLNWQLRRCR